MDFRPNYYRSYIDDTFVVIDDSSHVDKFLHFLNTRHANLKFTVEVESEHSLPFLDVLVECSQANYITNGF